jgi:hypothetical protein
VLLDERREEMLPAVVLHVVQPPGPIHLGLHLCARLEADGRLDEARVADTLHTQDARQAVDAAEVARLAATFGKEDRVL